MMVMGITGMALAALAAIHQADDTTCNIRQQRDAAVVYRMSPLPYWRLGGEFASLGAWAQDQPNTGPLYARFPPGDSADQQLEIGCFVQGEVHPPEGYERRTIPAHEAVVMIVDGPIGTASQHAHAMRQWARAEGYQPIDGVTEVYLDHARTELRIPLRPAGESAEKSTPPKPSPSMAELLRQQEYDRAAALLAEKSRATNDTEWIADVFDRLAVIRTIVKSKYADNADARKLLDAVLQRRTEHRESADPGVDSGTTMAVALLLGQQKKDALRALDRLMVRSHGGDLTPDDLCSEVASALIDVDVILGGELPRKNPGTSNADQP